MVDGEIENIPLEPAVLNLHKKKVYINVWR
jgi:hypothetical protein